MYLASEFSVNSAFWNSFVTEGQRHNFPCGTLLSLKVMKRQTPCGTVQIRWITFEGCTKYSALKLLVNTKILQKNENEEPLPDEKFTNFLDLFQNCKNMKTQ